MLILPSPNLRIVLVEPEIPPNTGNVARLCAATGSELWIVGEPAFSLADRYLKRAGLDYWESVRLFRTDSLGELTGRFADSQFRFLSTKGDRAYYDAEFEPGCFLVFGPETRGLDEKLLERNGDKVLTIPMNGDVRSLNLSTSVGIVAYEALRQIWTGGKR